MILFLPCVPFSRSEMQTGIDWAEPNANTRSLRVEICSLSRRDGAWDALWSRTWPEFNFGFTGELQPRIRIICGLDSEQTSFSPTRRLPDLRSAPLEQLGSR